MWKSASADVTPARCRAPGLACVVLATALPSQAAWASQAATATGRVEATVVAPLTVTATGDLDFGIVKTVPQAGGNVTIDPAGGAARYSGGAASGCSSEAPCPSTHPAQFVVNGEPYRDYRIGLPTSLDIRVDGAGAGDSLVIELTARTRSRPDAGAHGRLDETGADAFSVGGNVRIPANRPPARYRIPVPVTADYQ